jgi:hypothetical protein
MKLSAKVKETKSGQMAGLKRRYQSLHKEKVRIGFFEEQGAHIDPEGQEDGQLSYASLMTVLERGRLDGHIEGRPIFETTAFELDPASAQKPRSIIEKMLKELGTKDTVGQRLDDLGVLYREHVQDKFGDPSANGNFDNRPRTIAMKGKNTPLVKQGEGDLKANVAHKNTKTKRLKLG